VGLAFLSAKIRRDAKYDVYWPDRYLKTVAGEIVIRLKNQKGKPAPVYLREATYRSYNLPNPGARGMVGK